MNEQELEARVRREQAAHDDDDVLSRNHSLKKSWFPHVIGNSFYQAFRGSYDRYYGDLAGALILEIGCGTGAGSRRLALRGAQVCGIDISQNYVSTAASNAAAQGVSGCRFEVMDAHRLSFADGTFDFVVGDAILHHLDLHRALNEIRRVLKPGGRAMFIEPLADNPLLVLFRKMTPKARTVDERPLTSSDLDMIAKAWIIESDYYGLLAAPAAALTSLLARGTGPDNWLVRRAASAEKSISRKLHCESWNQFVFLNLQKPAAEPSL